MMTELCQELRNWFDRNQKKYLGRFEIKNGNLNSLDAPLELLDGQYFRIIGSVFNDGVHKYECINDTLHDESFKGAVWAMAVPPEVIALAEDISDWQDKYGKADSTAMSPYNSESFGGYSYSKSSGGGYGTSISGNGNGWKGMFADRLNRWRKI